MKLPRLGNGLPVAGAEKVLQEGGKGSARGLRNEGGGIDPEGGAAGESIPQGRASRQGGGNDGYALRVHCGHGLAAAHEGGDAPGVGGGPQVHEAMAIGIGGGVDAVVLRGGKEARYQLPLDSWLRNTCFMIARPPLTMGAA